MASDFLSAAGGVVLDAPPEHESFDEKIARLKEQLKSVPTLPGVYLWKDAARRNSSAPA